MEKMGLPKYVYTHVDKHGRIVIPADMRAELGLDPGEEVSLQIKDGRLQVRNVKRAIREHVGIGLRMHPELAGQSIVDEFIAEKRAEAERE
jgi:AbrB family looped-hinge helix DNA binding protein